MQKQHVTNKKSSKLWFLLRAASKVWVKLKEQPRFYDKSSSSRNSCSCCRNCKSCSNWDVYLCHCFDNFVQQLAGRERKLEGRLISDEIFQSNAHLAGKEMSASVSFPEITSPLLGEPLFKKKFHTCQGVHIDQSVENQHKFLALKPWHSKRCTYLVLSHCICDEGKKSCSTSASTDTNAQARSNRSLPPAFTDNPLLELDVPEPLSTFISFK